MDRIFERAGEFGSLLAAIYGVTVVLYFAMGFALDWLNRRNPERRIQQHRRGERRKRVEIRQSLVSILVTSLMVAIGLFAQYTGIAWTPWTLDWWSALPLFLLTMVLFDAWFYFAHRLLHTKPFYRFHVPHHRSVAPTAWSNDSIGIVDTAMSQGFYVVVVFLIPLPPVILLANRLFDHINGTIGHAGFEYFAGNSARAPSPLLCTIFHDQHHAEFKYNFANYFSWWDRLLGTVAPDYDRRVEQFAAAASPLHLGGDVPADEAPSSAGTGRERRSGLS